MKLAKVQTTIQISHVNPKNIEKKPKSARLTLAMNQGTKPIPWLFPIAKYGVRKMAAPREARSTRHTRGHRLPKRQMRPLAASPDIHVTTKAIPGLSEAQVATRLPRSLCMEGLGLTIQAQRRREKRQASPRRTPSRRSLPRLVRYRSLEGDVATSEQPIQLPPTGKAAC